jgi:hypothetical protein
VVKGRGGSRPGAGRRKGKLKDELAVKAPQLLAPAPDPHILAPIIAGDSLFFTEILDRIGEADIGSGPRKKITNAVDYALQKLYCGDKQIETLIFKMVLEHKYGRPAQGVFVGDTREHSRPLTYGNMPRTIVASDAGGSRKPQ